LYPHQVSFRIAQHLNQPLRLRTPIAHITGHDLEMMHIAHYSIYALKTYLIVPEIFPFMKSKLDILDCWISRSYSGFRLPTALSIQSSFTWRHLRGTILFSK
jgi:hypothetical protein